MRIIDYLLLGAVMLAMLAAVICVIKRRKQGKTCAGNCANCGQRCTKAD